VVEGLGVREDRGFSGFNLDAFDGHAHVYDVSLSALGHRHADDVVFPCEVISYHCTDAVGRGGYVWIQILF